MRITNTVMLGLLVAVTACARATSTAAMNQPAGNVVVQVRNDAFWDATVYLLRSSSERVRLGIAGSFATTSLTVLRSVLMGLDQVRFQIAWIGRSGRDTSDSILAQPGDTIVLQLHE